jgi:muramoyltetrapeptide carboxypeptidase
MFADDEVDAIITLRGGYGSARLLPYLDYDLIRSNPKVITGFSDVTALLTAIHVETGLVTFNAPDAEMRYTPYTLSEFKKVLFHPTPTTGIGSPPPFEAREGWVEYTNRLERILPGKVSGQLLGGNLRMLVDLLGTPYEPDFRDKILFVEEVGTGTEEVDRSLSHLWLSGKLQQVKGIAFGQCVDISYLSTWAHSFTLEQVLAERCIELGIPAITGLMIGHIDDFTTVPIGCQAQLDVEAGTLKLLEAAVR